VAARGLGQVLDERRHQRRRRTGTRAGRQQVQGAVLGQEGVGVEALTVSRGYGIEDSGVCERVEGESNALPDRVAGAGVGVDHRPQRVSPPFRRATVGLEDMDGIGCRGGVERPLIQGPGVAPVQGGGVQQGLDGGGGLAFPEPAALHATASKAGPGGEAGGADHRRQRVLTAPDRGPTQPCRQTGRQVLGIEYRNRPEFLSGRQGHGEVVGAGGGRQHRAGRVQDGVDDDVKALAGAWRADQQHRVLHRRPHLPAL
jgi:hypothetical protein